MPIEFKDNLLDTTILDIIKKVKQECPNNYFKDIIIKHDYIRVTCPYHKGGHESNPSCSIYCGSDSKLPQGILHCFTCGEAHTLDQWVGYCFNKDAAFGEEWLLKKFCNNTIKTNNTLLPIEQKENNNYIDPSILNDFKPYHPYMTKRKLTEEIIKKFNIKYDPKTESIVFPVWDEHNKLVMLTKRNVNKKLFFIDENKEKPVYLLNNIINNNIKTVYVCESQINTLTLYGWGYNAIGLIGTGTPYQYDKLKKSGINHFILALDKDEAGDKGVIRFINKMPKDIMIDVMEIPPGKDVNDLTKEEFQKLNILDSYEWLQKYKK